MKVVLVAAVFVTLLAMPALAESLQTPSGHRIAVAAGWHATQNEEGVRIATSAAALAASEMGAVANETTLGVSFLPGAMLAGFPPEVTASAGAFASFMAAFMVGEEGLAVNGEAAPVAEIADAALISLTGPNGEQGVMLAHIDDAWVTIAVAVGVIDRDLDDVIAMVGSALNR